MTMFDPARGAVQDPDRPSKPHDPFDDSAILNERCAKCGHRYGSHGDKGCKFMHQRGMLCPCKAFRKATK